MRTMNMPIQTHGRYPEISEPSLKNPGAKANKQEQAEPQKGTNTKKHKKGPKRPGNNPGRETRFLIVNPAQGASSDRQNSWRKRHTFRSHFA
jgi:hypothetical protein